MSPIIKKILIFVVIMILVLGGYYFFFMKNSAPATETSLVLTTENAPITNTPTDTTPATNAYMTEDLLALLLNVRNIKIDDALFSMPAFTSLNDSTIELIQEGNEGRINPFAPIGVDPVVISTSPIDTTVPTITDENTIQVSETPAPQGNSPAAPSTLNVLNTTTTNTKTASATKSTTTSGIKITPNN